MQLKLDLLPGSSWVLAIFFEVMTPLLKAVVSWWIHCCVFLFALVIMQDFPTLWALGCSLSADSCARALGPPDKLVGYWLNSSSSSDIAIPFFSFTVLFLQCYLLFFVLLCDLLLRCCTRIPCTVWYPDLGPFFSLCYCVIFFLLSSFAIFFFVFFVWSSSSVLHPDTMYCLISWLGSLFWVSSCFEVDLLLVLCWYLPRIANF